MGTVDDAVGMAGLKAALAALRSDDLARAQARGAALGGMAWRLDPRWRRLAEANVAAALPAADAVAVVRENYRHYGRMLAELANVDALADRGDELFSTSGDEHVAALRNGGLIITGHVGNWEVVGAAHTRRHGRLHALVKPINNHRVDRWINGVRRRLGIEPVVTRDSALAVRKLLREGAVVVVVGDQNSLYHEGVFVPFFGRPASTHYGPAMLALRLGLPVLTAFGTRTAAGGFHVAYEPPLELPTEGSLRERTWALTAAYTARIEAAVRRCPEQWFWVHRRWKNQPRADVPAWKYGPEGRPDRELAPPPPTTYNRGITE